MRTRISYWLEILKSSFWLLPGLVSLALLSLVFLVETIEPAAGGPLDPERLFGGATAEGTRLLLSSIATALMTVVGVLFSVTIVVLQQVSQQFSPRVIDHFIRSKANQFVLGFYVGTFGYSLVLLRTIQNESQKPLPQLGPLLAIFLALVCLALLIFYIHRLATSIKSNMILAAIRVEAIRTLTSLQTDLTQNHHQTLPGELKESQAFTLRARKVGYLQEISWWELRGALHRGRWQAESLVIPGDYIHLGIPLLRLRTAAPLTSRQKRRLEKMFVIDLIRTHSQDVRFGVRQMVDVALRALSPGINDPSTAIEAINEIGSVLAVYTRECVRTGHMHYRDGSRLYLKEPTYREFVDLCVNEIAIDGERFHLVLRALQRIVELAAGTTVEPERQRVLQDKSDYLAEKVALAPGADSFTVPTPEAGR